MRIAVVIPVLDDADELAGALEALAAQSRPADAVVVVDNGCADNSPELASEAGALVVFEPTRGIPAAAARGYDVAAAGTSPGGIAADVIARIDADSRPPRDWLARIERAFSDDPSLDALTGPGRFMGLSPRREWWARVSYMEAYFVAMGAALLVNPPLFGSNMALRTSTWVRVRDRVRRHDRRVHDDVDLSFALDLDHRVRLDRDLVVGISARPFDEPSGMIERYRRAFRTIWFGWHRTPPWVRVRHRLEARGPS